MTPTELQGIISAISDGDNINLKQIEKELIKVLSAQVNDSLVISRGRIQDINETPGSIVKKSIRSFYNSKAYRNSLAKILQNIGDATDAKLGVYKGNGLEVKKGFINQAQKLSIDEFLDNMNEDGLNAKFNQPMRQLIYDAVRNNASQADLLKNINARIESGKVDSDFAKYVKNATRQAADAATKVVDQAIYDRFQSRITHILVTGSLIETSSPQCRQAVEKYNRKIPIDKLDEWIAFAKKNGASDELNKDNIFTLGGHYACRHQWIPYIESK